MIVVYGGKNCEKSGITVSIFDNQKYETDSEIQKAIRAHTATNLKSNCVKAKKN